MAFEVTFDFTDQWNRKTTRRWYNNQALVATVLTDIAALAPLYDAVGLGGISGVVITQKSTATTLAAGGASNIDANASIKVIAGDGYKYDFDLPMPSSTILNNDGTIITDDTDLVAFFNEFATAGHWRINLRNPTDVVTIDGGSVDK